MSLSPSKALLCLSFIVFILAGCGGGSNTTPPSLTITSTPPSAAVEGAQYSYQLAATSSNSGSVTFTLSAAPSGATLSGSTISWTPTHAESRVSSSFTVTATTAAGGSATQSWTVTPNGTVNITAVVTYWTPSGSLNVNPQWIASNPFPAALVPQSDGSLQRLQGAANADGSFSIPDVPGGFYWLQINPNANYWTSTSDFDFGQDVIGRPPVSSSQTTTTFSYSVSGLLPTANAGNIFVSQSDLHSFALPFFSLQANTSTFNGSLAVTSNLDWSQVDTLYLSEYFFVGTSVSFNGYILGPAKTLTSLSFTNGATNSIGGNLTLSPSTSVPINITGSAWAALASSAGPGTPAPVFSDYAAYVQPYVNDRLALPAAGSSLGPDLVLLRPAVPSAARPSSYACELSIEATIKLSALNIGVPPITSDVDYGSTPYSDPYPSNWLRMFDYCQVSAVSFPRPNSMVTDTFYVTNKQTTPLPSGPVAPILSSVQSPMLNGGSFFQSATLNSTTVNIGWNPPATGQPFGYFVEVYQLVTLPSGSTGYAPAGNYGTAKTSLTIPFISPSSTYVFAILAASDANANIEKNPLRHKIPFAESAVVSAPFVIQ